MVAMKKIENFNVVDKKLIPWKKQRRETSSQFMPSSKFNALTPSNETMEQYHDATSPKPIYC